MGPIFARDGDDVILKTNIQSGQAPFSINWMKNGQVFKVVICSSNVNLYIVGQELVFSNRVSPYNRPGCIGIKIIRAGTDDEGHYQCYVRNASGEATFNATLLVDCKYYIKRPNF